MSSCKINGTHRIARARIYALCTRHTAYYYYFFVFQGMNDDDHGHDDKCVKYVNVCFVLSPLSRCDGW